MLAAVVWVTQREPEYKSQNVRHDASSPTQAAPPVTGSVPTRNSARVTAVDEKVVTKPDVPTKDKAAGAEWRADEVAPSENERKEIAAQSAPSTGALRKSAPAAAPTFAPPPSSEVATRERKQAAEPAPAPQPAAMKMAAPKPVDSKDASKAEEKAQWGEVKNGYRDSGGAALYQVQTVSVPEQLAQGTLPDPATLVNHPIVRAASSTAYATARTVSLPLDIATEADIQKSGSRPYEAYAPGEQAAAIAYAFERAIAQPAATPRARIERMLVHARAIEDRAGKADKPGATRLVAMIEGALEVWPN